MADKKSRSNSIAANAKGDLVVGTGSAASGIVAVGTNNQTILADSTQTAGIKWAASPTSVLGTTGDILYASSANTLAALAAGTSGYALTANGAGVAPSWQAVPVFNPTLLSTTTITTSPTTISGISGSSYSVLYIQLIFPKLSTGTGTIALTINGTATGYVGYTFGGSTGAWSTSVPTLSIDTSSQPTGFVTIYNCKGTSGNKYISLTGATTASYSNQVTVGNGYLPLSAAITSLTFTATNMNGGTIYLFGA